MISYWCIFDYDGSVKKICDIDTLLLNNEYSSDFERLLIDKSNLLKMVNKIDFFLSEIFDILELFNLLKVDDDTILFNELVNRFKLIKSDFCVFELECFFSSVNDKSDAFLDINAGSGGLESQNWVEMLVKMYIGWSIKNGFKYVVTSLTYGEAGFKNISMKILGKYAFGFLKNESGVHRLVRKSPFDSNNKRHTSFASVFVYPVCENDSEIKIIESDLRIDTFRASGAGGQHVNTTESAVRIIHIPTGIMVQCQSERSQHQNKASALKQLKSKLKRFYDIEKKKSRNELEKSKLSISWGSQIRSYILDKSVIKDLRSNLELYDINMVLDGHLNPFIFSVFYLKSELYE